METLVKRSALVLPTTGYELDREEMSYLDGGGRLNISISFTPGGFVSGLTGGFIGGLVGGYCAGLGVKLGKFGGWAGSLIAGALCMGIGFIISEMINSAIYNNSERSVTLINCWIPFFSFSYNYDIGKKLGKIIGGIGGGMSGAAAAAIGFGMGAIG